MPVTGDPPLSVTVASTVMAPSPGMRVTPGAPGTVAGATCTGAEARDTPTALTARISTGYCVPLAMGVDPSVERSVMTSGSAVDVALHHVTPPSVEYW